jgi:ribosomal protein L13E
LSQKPKKSRAVAKKEPKVPRPEVSKPTGHVPTATVSSRHGADLVMRPGRGFSLGEIESAGVHLHTAKTWGLPLDIRRRSVLEGNVTSVKKWVAHPKSAGSQEGEVKRIEEEIVKLEKEVKKEVAKVKKEVKKVEKEVAEEVEKVEKPVRSKGRKKSTAAKKAT